MHSKLEFYSATDTKAHAATLEVAVWRRSPLTVHVETDVGQETRHKRRASKALAACPRPGHQRTRWSNVVECAPGLRERSQVCMGKGNWELVNPEDLKPGAPVLLIAETAPLRGLPRFGAHALCSQAQARASVRTRCAARARRDVTSRNRGRCANAARRRQRCSGWPPKGQRRSGWTKTRSRRSRRDGWAVRGKFTRTTVTWCPFTGARAPKLNEVRKATRG